MTKVKARPKVKAMSKIKGVDHFIWCQVSGFRKQTIDIRAQMTEI
jgi:hypothetical protein